MYAWQKQFGEEERWPPSLKALYDDGIIECQSRFRCRVRGKWPVGSEFVTDYESIMGRAGFPITQAMTEEEDWLPLAWEKEGLYRFHTTRRVVFFDSHVETLDEARFEKLMERVDAWIEENRPYGDY